MRPSGRHSNRRERRNPLENRQLLKHTDEATHMTAAEPIYDVAHLGHVELLTDKPDASLDFFTRVFGLTESGREGDSVYLRAFDDYEFHSLKLTAAKTTGIRHIGYRAAGPLALQRRVKAIEALSAGIGWSDGDKAHGPAYRFHDPD